MYVLYEKKQDPIDHQDRGGEGGKCLISCDIKQKIGFLELCFILLLRWRLPRQRRRRQMAGSKRQRTGSGNTVISSFNFIYVGMERGVSISTLVFKILGLGDSVFISIFSDDRPKIYNVELKD